MNRDDCQMFCRLVRFDLGVHVEFKQKVLLLLV